ncbi:hypothetical protein [Anaerovibrio sp.]|uniref:hypothetical protein n=1 Tax=Anaerovibrio sp. TaxID=1872532 RepID=UPI003F16B4A9
MKRILLLALVLAGLFVRPAFAEYSGDQQVREFIPCIAGIWVDEAGHRQMHIFGGQDGINTFRITNIRDWQGNSQDGSAVITVMEKRGSREMSVAYHRDGDDSWLLLDGRLKVVPEQQEKIHAESVGGVMLDMPLMKLLRLYGPPTDYLEEADTQALCGVSSYAWYYRSEGWLVTFDPSSGTVDRIFLFPGSSKFLDRAVLNCDSPLERFAGLYGLHKTPAPGDVFHLGQQEYLSFAGYPGYICLSIYDN